MNTLSRLTKMEERAKELRSRNEEPIEGLFRDDTKEPHEWYVYRLIDGERKPVVVSEEEAQGIAKRWHKKWGNSSPYIYLSKPKL